MKRSWILGLVLCSVCLAGAAPQRAAVDSGSYVIEKNVMVPMRDGVRLAADLYFPARDGVRLQGKFPAVLERTPYNKDGAGESWGPYYAGRGYVAVAQDTRGRYNSEGVWHMMTDDAPMVTTRRSGLSRSRGAMAASPRSGLRIPEARSMRSP